MADKYGRKKLILLGLVVQATCYSLFLFAQNTFVYYIAIMIMGASAPLKSMIAYTHLMEFIPGKVGTMSGIMIFFDGMVLVISPLILMLITNNTEFFLWLGLIMNVTGLCGFIFMYIPESVKFQLETGKFKEAESDIRYVLKFNKVSEP